MNSLLEKKLNNTLKKKIKHKQYVGKN